MANAADDLEAVRTIVSAIEEFQPDEYRRIIRWSEEKLGLALASGEGTRNGKTRLANPPSA